MKFQNDSKDSAEFYLQTSPKKKSGSNVTCVVLNPECFNKFFCFFVDTLKSMLNLTMQDLVTLPQKLLHSNLDLWNNFHLIWNHI